MDVVLSYSIGLFLRINMVKSHLKYIDKGDQIYEEWF